MEDFKYTCLGTNKEYMGKPWISLNLKRWDGLSGPVTFSSYLEYKRSLNQLPKKHYDLILNKEDFNEPRPVVYKPPEIEFNFLTETELDSLTYEQYRQYQHELSDHFMMNPLRSEIYLEQMENDRYTQSLEHEYSSEDDIVTDDY